MGAVSYLRVTYQVTLIANAPITAATAAPVATMPTAVPSSKGVKIGAIHHCLWSKLDIRQWNDTEIAHRYCRPGCVSALTIGIEHG